VLAKAQRRKVRFCHCGFATLGDNFITGRFFLKKQEFWQNRLNFKRGIVHPFSIHSQTKNKQK